jgi:methylated-DNA-[protein]-cysteine S-methyltransferase
MADLRRCSVTIETKLGPLRVDFTSRGVCRLDFCRTGAPPATPEQRQAKRLPCQLVRQLQAYASSRPVRFTVPVDLSAGTDFQKKVWRALQTIPPGQTRSYAWVARKIGKPRAARAVGAACGANPVPIVVPCHRVIASDGSLGGYTGGLHRKKRLLKLEQAKISRLPIV